MDNRVSLSMESYEKISERIAAYREFYLDIRHIVLDLPEHEMERTLWKALNDLERKLEQQ